MPPQWEHFETMPPLSALMWANPPHAVHEVSPSTETVFRRKIISLEPGNTENQKVISSLRIQTSAYRHLRALGAQHTGIQRNEKKTLKTQETAEREAGEAERPLRQLVKSHFEDNPKGWHTLTENRVIQEMKL